MRLRHGQRRRQGGQGAGAHRPVRAHAAHAVQLLLAKLRRPRPDCARGSGFGWDHNGAAHARKWRRHEGPTTQWFWRRGDGNGCVCVFGFRVVAAGGPTDNGVNTTQYARTQRTNGGGGGLGAGFVSEVRGSAGERGEAKERPRGSIGDWPARNGQINAHKSTETDRNETGGGGVFVFLLLMVGDQCGRGCGDVGFVW